MPFHKLVSIPTFHNTPPTPNNNIAIILNHTVLSQPPRGKVWNECEFIFISLCVWMTKGTTFLAYICLPLKKKKMLPYISASHLVCIGETMQSTPVCQWRFLESHCLENARKVVFFSLSLAVCVLVFAGKCLDGRRKTGARVRKKKANVESKQEKKKILTVCELISGYTLRR